MNNTRLRTGKSLKSSCIAALSTAMIGILSGCGAGAGQGPASLTLGSDGTLTITSTAFSGSLTICGGTVTGTGTKSSNGDFNIKGSFTASGNGITSYGTIVYTASTLIITINGNTPTGSTCSSPTSSSSSSGSSSSGGSTSGSGSGSGSSSGGTTGGTNSAFTSSDRQSCIAYMNTTYRQPAGLAALVETAELDNDADAAGPYDATHGGVHSHAGSINVGENWYAQSNQVDFLSACKSAIDSWWSEKSQYDSNGNVCNEQTGHYCNLAAKGGNTNYSSVGVGGNDDYQPSGGGTWQQIYMDFK